MLLALHLLVVSLKKKDADKTVVPINSPAEPLSNSATSPYVVATKKIDSETEAQTSKTPPKPTATTPQITLLQPEGMQADVYKDYENVTNTALILIFDSRIDAGLTSSLAGEKISINPVLSIVEQAKELKAIIAKQFEKGTIAGNFDYYDKIIAGQIVTDSLLMTLGSKADITGEHFIFIESGTYQKGLAYVVAALGNELQHIGILNDPTFKNLSTEEREVIAFRRSIEVLKQIKTTLGEQVKTSENPTIQKLINDLKNVIAEDEIKFQSWKDAVESNSNAQR